MNHLKEQQFSDGSAEFGRGKHCFEGDPLSKWPRTAATDVQVAVLRNTEVEDTRFTVLPIAKEVGFSSRSVKDMQPNGLRLSKNSTR